MKIIGFAIATVAFLAYSCWAWARHFEFGALVSGFFFLTCLIIVLREAQHRQCD